MNSKDPKEELREIFADLLNYCTEDVLEPIDPMTWRSPEGDSCLHYAAIRGNLRAAQLLIALGSDINCRGDLGNTPLHYAVEFENVDVASTLIEAGAQTDVVNEFGRTPL